MDMPTTEINQPSPGSTFFQEPEKMRSTEKSMLSRYISELKSNQKKWATQDLSHMENLLVKTINSMSSVRTEWLEISTRQKGSEGNPVLVAEELFVIGAIGGFLNDLRKSISIIRTTGKAPLLKKDIYLGSLPGKRIKPHGILDLMLLPGISIDVLFKPGTGNDEIVKNQAIRYSKPEPDGAVCLILAAGNVSHLPGIDILTKLFVDRRVVLCKVNPINEYLGPVYEKGFAPLIEEGILRFAYGGRETGEYLTTHVGIDELHLTGSKGTYEAIAYGTESDAQERIEKNTPINHKPFTTELGNVSPVIVVPGEWSEKTLISQAQELAAWTTVVAGYGCLTPRVILTHKEWPIRERFLEELDKAMRAVPAKQLYYPGTKGRIAALEKVSTDKMVKINDKETGDLKCAHIFGLDPEKDDELHFRYEHFCPVLSEIPVSANTVEEFCEKSTALANKQLWGTLNAYIIIDPKIEKKYEKALTGMISDLDYGSIFINMYAGFGHVLHSAPWGGAPGRKPNQIDSGIGWGNDPNMFGNPLKTVFKSPLKKMYDPMLHTAKNRVAFCHGLCDYQYKPTLWNGLKLFALVGRSLV